MNFEFSLNHNVTVNEARREGRYLARGVIERVSNGEGQAESMLYLSHVNKKYRWLPITREIQLEQTN